MDGLLTAVRFLSLAAANRVSVAELAGAMRRHPQVMINVPAPDRGASLDGASLEQAIALAEAELGDGGRVLVRPSGTEPLIRVMVESETEADSQRHAEALADAVRVALGSSP